MALIGLSVVTAALALISVGLITGIFTMRWRIISRQHRRSAVTAQAAVPVVPSRRNSTPTIYPPVELQMAPIQTSPPPINVHLAAVQRMEGSIEDLPEDEDERLGTLGKSGWPSEEV